MFGDLNIFRFIMLVLMFVVSIIFLIVSLDVISIFFRLKWFGIGFLFIGNLFSECEVLCCWCSLAVV